MDGDFRGHLADGSWLEEEIPLDVCLSRRGKGQGFIKGLYKAMPKNDDISSCNRFIPKSCIPYQK